MVNTSQRMSASTASILANQVDVDTESTHVKAMVSAWLKPAAANCARVVAKSVVGSGTPTGPAVSASIRPVRGRMPVLAPPHSATEAMTPFIR